MFSFFPFFSFHTDSVCCCLRLSTFYLFIKINTFYWYMKQLLFRYNKCDSFIVIMKSANNYLSTEYVCFKYVYYSDNAICTSYYKSSSVCLFVCLSVCLFVPYLLRGPLTDLRQTWWVYVGGPRNCPWGVLFRKGQRLDGSTGHFRFPLYYICASLTPHSCKRRLCCYCI